MTVLAKLVAKERDLLGYTTYVFECLDEEIRKETKYVMCTRFPNWEHGPVEIGEIGYLNFIEIRAGVDVYYNGEKMIPYRYNNIQFIKFVLAPKINKQNYVM